jgi:hypothetical protein
LCQVASNISVYWKDPGLRWFHSRIFHCLYHAAERALHGDLSNGNRTISSCRRWAFPSSIFHLEPFPSPGVSSHLPPPVLRLPSTFSSRRLLQLSQYLSRMFRRKACREHCLSLIFLRAFTNGSSLRCPSDDDDGNALFDSQVYPEPVPYALLCAYENGPICFYKENVSRIYRAYAIINDCKSLGVTRHFKHRVPQSRSHSRVGNFP